MAEAIKIQGLSEFSKDLRTLDSELPKALRLALNEAANVVVTYAQAHVPSRSGRARRSIRARSTRTAVRVAAGGKRAPYYPWLDFGGAVGKRKSVRRPFLKEGRYLWKGYGVKHEEVQRVLEEALLDVVRQAGFEVD